MAKGEIFKGLPKWAQGVIVIAAIGAAGLITYAVYKKIKNSRGQKGAKEEEKQVKSELNELISKGKTPTLTASQLSSVANNLHTAMDGYGTNYDMILKEVAKLNNDADVLGVTSSYGIREISTGRWNPEPNFKGTLGQTFVEELRSDQLTAIKNMLARKGIKYRF